MLIRQKRIRNLERYVPEEYKGQELRVRITDLQAHTAKLRRAGFSDELGVGEVVLPAIVGPVTRFNAEGKQIVRRDLDKETAFRQVEWHWIERHGDDRVERSDFRYVPYQRYPRDLLPPPSLELVIVEDAEGNRLVATESVLYSEENRALLTHAINVCLEVFGECEVLTGELVRAMRTPLRRLNWHLLPPGKYPWTRLKEDIRPIIERATKGKRSVISRRLEYISEFDPKFVAIGRGGFNGYVVFGFPDHGLFVLESAFYGNATYVFEQDWEELSQMTKAQILNEELQKARIVHIEGWDERVRRLFR